MCKIICNVTYTCGHVEPWVTRRSCQYDILGNPKPLSTDPLCLLFNHCWNFGKVRQINISDSLLCSSCFIAKTMKSKGISEESRTGRIAAAKKDADFHAQKARESIAESEKRACLEDLSTKYINKVTGVALKRLDLAFEDGQMEEHHFAELFQITIGLPLLDKGRLVEKFAGKIEENFGPKDVKYFYELSTKYRNWGDEFRKGLKDPSVLDKVEKK